MEGKTSCQCVVKQTIADGYDDDGGDDDDGDERENDDFESEHQFSTKTLCFHM